MKLITRVIYSAMFGCFLFNHVNNFSIRYFKFASIKLINENGLHYFYFFMIAFELVSIIIPFVKLRRPFIIAYDLLFVIYALTVPTALFCLYELTNGCPECHFISSSFISNQYFNSIAVLVLGLVYLFSLRDRIAGKQIAA